MRLRSFDNYLITAMSAVALLSIYMLYGAKIVNTGSGEIKIASIVEQLKTVKRKRDFYQGWMDVKPGDGLSENDEIYTHEQSSAQIKFENGPEVSLFENSLLRIKDSKLSLDKGNMIAKLTSESPVLDIEMNGKKYSFNSNNANIQIEQSKTENKFLLLDGKASMSGQDILPNQVVIQNIKTGDIKIKQIPYVPKSPANNLHQYYLEKALVHFSWSNLNKGGPLKLLVSRDSDFSEIVFEESTELTTLSREFNLPGTYYWKLISSDLLDGPIRSFTLHEEESPELSTDHLEIFKSPKMTDKIFLSWQKNIGKNFIVKITNPEGQSEEFKTTKNNFEYTPATLGQYNLSFKVQDSNRPLALWSNTVAVTVNNVKPITISSLTPELMEKVNYSQQASNYLLSWSGPSYGVTYKIKLTKDKKISEFETESTSAPLSLKDAGTYHWEVTGVSATGALSNIITGKIIIKAPLRISQLPSEGAIVELEKPDQLVAFKWDKIEEATLYQFELSDDPAFSKIIVARDLNTNNISTSLADTGRYYWRVKIKKGDSVEYSNPVSVEIKPAPPLARPEISPDLKIKLKYQEETSSFNIFDLLISSVHAADPMAIAEWDLPANPKAKSYVVEVYKDQELKELVVKMETTIPHAVWKNAAPGIFYWRVSYIDFWGRQTEFSRVSVLSAELEIKKPMPVEIELQNPKNRARILMLEKDVYTFNWENIPEVKNYQFSILTDKNVFNKIVKKNEFSLSCQDLENRAGEYYWQVTSGENTSKKRSFKAVCAPPPPVIAPTLPKEEISQPVIAQVKKEKFLDHFLRVGLFPHHVTYQNKANAYTAKIDGNAINSWMVSYQRPMNFTYFTSLSPSLSVSRGKVFNDITFTDIEFNLKAKREQSQFSWGPVAAFMKKTLYVESNLAITDESVTSPIVGLFIQKDLGDLTLNGEIKLGSILDYHADLQYKLKNNFSIGTFFDASAITKDDNKHTFNRYGLNVNYTFDFLETNK